MNIHKDLEKITMIAMHYAKEHKCNYYIIMTNPDENGEFQDSSTYEYVAASYFEKERTCKVISTTEELWSREEIEPGSPFKQIDHEAFINEVNSSYKIRNYSSPTEESRYRRPQQYRRESPKIQRNSKCPCESGKKYKHCCLK